MVTNTTAAAAIGKPFNGTTWIFWRSMRGCSGGDGATLFTVSVMLPPDLARKRLQFNCCRSSSPALATEPTDFSRLVDEIHPTQRQVVDPVGAQPLAGGNRSLEFFITENLP